MTDEAGRGVILRDLVIFQIKLVIDGVKDLVVSPVAIGAAALDVLFPTDRRGHRFYSVMRLAETFDRLLNLYGASEHAEEKVAGLFGKNAGGDGLVGRIEEIVTGRRQSDGELEGRRAGL